MTDDELRKEFDTIFTDKPDSSQKIREVSWFRNILFYLGEHWIAWYANQNTFGGRGMLINEPTPVANKIRDHVRSMKALILNKNFTPRIWPNSEEQKDKDAAKLGIRVLKWLDSLESNQTEDVKELIVLWTILTGNGFSRAYPCLDTGKYVKDKNGTVITKAEPVVECVSPFSVVVPVSGMFLKNKRYTGIKTLKQKEWVEDTFKVKIDSQDSDPSVIEYEKQLMTLIANVSPWKGAGLGSTSDVTAMNNEDLVIYKELEFRPTKKYPKGVYGAMAGGKVLFNKKELPIKVSENGEWEYTLTHFAYNPTPGSFWPTSSIDDLISPQVTINEIDQALATNRKSLGRPFVLSPYDLVIKRRSEAGQNLLVLEYDPLLSGGLEPKVERGTPYPEQILAERDLKVGNIQDAWENPKNTLKGKAPTAKASGIMEIF